MLMRTWTLRLPDGETVEVVEATALADACGPPDVVGWEQLEGELWDAQQRVRELESQLENWKAAATLAEQQYGEASHVAVVRRELEKAEADRDGAWQAYTDLAEVVIGPEGVVTLGVEHDPDRAWMTRHWRAALEQCKAWKVRALEAEARLDGRA